MLSTEEILPERSPESKRFCVTLHISMPKAASLPMKWKSTIESALAKTAIDQITDMVWDFVIPRDSYKRGSFRIITDQALALTEIMGWKTIECESAILNVTQKDILEDAIHWHTEGITPTHFHFHLIAVNTKNVQIFNTSKYRGMLYNAIEAIDPKFAKQLHMHPRASQWNFGTVIAEKFDRPLQSGFKGDYTIAQYTRLKLHVTTIYPDIADRLRKIKEMQLGELKLCVKKCDPTDKPYQLPPVRFSAITIQFNTPLILFDRKTKTYLPLTEKNLIDIQLDKLKKSGVLTTDMADLHDYIRFLQVPDRKKGLTVVLDNGQQRRFEGLVGFLTIKIMGDDLIKEHLHHLFQISQFTGLGTNCNVGFGQHVIKAIR